MAGEVRVSSFFFFPLSLSALGKFRAQMVVVQLPRWATVVGLSLETPNLEALV